MLRGGVWKDRFRRMPLLLLPGAADGGLVGDDTADEPGGGGG